MCSRFPVTLKELRHSRKLSVEQLSDCSTVSETRIKTLESADDNPSENELFFLACGLQVNPSAFTSRLTGRGL